MQLSVIYPRIDMLLQKSKVKPRMHEINKDITQMH